MRITNNMLINNMMTSLGDNLTRMQKFQSQLSTGKKISMPSDDPVVAARALKLRTDVSEIEQYKRNVEDATSWMEITETALGQMGEVMHRVRELGVQAANGSNAPDDLQKIKSEIVQLKTQMTHLANTTYAGRYIFSGYKTDKALMDEDGTFNIDVENTEEILFEIGIGDDININVAGGDLFNAGANSVAATKSSLIQTFDDIIGELDTGDSVAVSNLLGSIDNDIGNILRVRSGIGARMNRLELTGNRLEDDSINFTRLMSKNEDVDIAEAIMQLQNEENVYRSSLAAGAKIIMPSLVDFLR